jgi:hypothetical protein
MENVRKEAKYPEVTLSEYICSKIKNIYFADKIWPECYRQVANKFTEFKVIVRKFYGGYTRDDNIELLKRVRHFAENDIKEAFEMPMKEEKKVPEEKKKYSDKVIWVPVPVHSPEILEAVNKLLGSSK